MTSPYLDNTRSPEELDALIKKHLMGVAASEKKLVETDIPDLLGSIGRVCEDSIAKIEAKSKQVVAKVSAWVETATAEFFKETETARLEIANIVDDPSYSSSIDRVTGMVAEVSFLSMNRISQRSERSVSKIRSEVEQSVQELRQKTADAFKHFRALAAKVAARIKETVAKTVKAYETDQNASAGSSSLRQVKLEITKAAAEAERASAELMTAKDQTITSINEALDAANLRIDQALAKAVREIQQAEEKAVAVLNETAQVALRHYASNQANIS